MVDVSALELADAATGPITQERIDGLFRPEGRVHSDVYTSRAIFDAEFERIFHRSWIYVGHKSEVPSVGDFRLRKIGKHPVIMVRGSDNVVRILMNRCRHRGAIVCELKRGNTKRFRCWYHGWTYDTTGKLVNIEGVDAYKDGVDTEAMGLTPAPRFADYRGFIFASLSQEGPTLDEYLGRAKEQIDYVIDLSPVGEIAVDYGVHHTRFLGNWKLVGMDGYHPNVLHASVFNELRKGKNVYRDPWEDGANTCTRHLGNGHVMLDLLPQRMDHLEEHIARVRAVPGGDQYIKDMYASYGEERGNKLMAAAGDPHMGVYPNLQLIGAHIRVMNPIAPGHTEVDMYPIRLLGVSDEINEWRLRQHEYVYGPAGSVSPDDAEIFERSQAGMMASVDPWLDLRRGQGLEEVDADGATIGKITSELTQRYQLEAWKTMMSNVH